jgi:hypothetical protein
MVAALDESQIAELYGTLASLLQEQSVSSIRKIAGEAGFDRTLIPDGLTPTGAARPPVVSAIDGQFGTWEHARRAAALPRLAGGLLRHLKQKRMDYRLNQQLTEIGWRFDNGRFVPVDAHGEIIR